MNTLEFLTANVPDISIRSWRNPKLKRGQMLDLKSSGGHKPNSKSVLMLEGTDEEPILLRVGTLSGIMGDK